MMMESTTEANAIQFIPLLFYDSLRDWQCIVCGMSFVLMKWKHTLKVSKRQTHRTSFMSFNISIKVHHGSKCLQDSIQFSPLLFIIYLMTDWWCTICVMQLVLMKWKHTLKVTKWQTHRVSFMTHDYINRFDISINNTKAEPTKISHILISHNFHWHNWSILFKVIMEGFLRCFPKWGRQPAHNNLSVSLFVNP
jgi:hypothetical protein